jgi:hypothetical protein
VACLVHIESITTANSLKYANLMKASIKNQNSSKQRLKLEAVLHLNLNILDMPTTIIANVFLWGREWFKTLKMIYKPFFVWIDLAIDYVEK